jgi:hypothetical protein
MTSFSLILTPFYYSDVSLLKTDVTLFVSCLIDINSKTSEIDSVIVIEDHPVSTDCHGDSTDNGDNNDANVNNGANNNIDEDQDNKDEDVDWRHLIVMKNLKHDHLESIQLVPIVISKVFIYVSIYYYPSNILCIYVSMYLLGISTSRRGVGIYNN